MAHRSPHTCHETAKGGCLPFSLSLLLTGLGVSLPCLQRIVPCVASLSHGLRCPPPQPTLANPGIASIMQTQYRSSFQCQCSQPGASRRRAVITSIAQPQQEASTSGRQLELPAPTPVPPAPGILSANLPPVKPWIRPPQQKLTPPSVRDSGTLRPAPEWFPAWMKYRRREENHIFWFDKFSRNSVHIPGARRAVQCRPTCRRRCMPPHPPGSHAHDARALLPSWGHAPP